MFTNANGFSAARTNSARTRLSGRRHERFRRTPLHLNRLPPLNCRKPREIETDPRNFVWRTVIHSSMGTRSQYPVENGVPKGGKQRYAGDSCAEDPFTQTARKQVRCIRRWEMAVFAYRGVDPARRDIQGTIAADTPRQARDLLRQQGVLIEDLSEHSARMPQSLRWPWRRGRGGTQLVAATRDLATLLSVGVTLVDALDVILEEQPPVLRTSLLQLRDRVAGGVGLAEAMAEQPEMFDELYVHMVDVGENSGNLDAVLRQLAGFKERSLELKDRVLSALLYPAIVLAAALAATVFLMTVVVPMLLDNLLEAGRELPWPTRLLKGSSDFLVHHGWWLGIMAVLSVASVIVAMQTDMGRRVWYRGLMRIPLIGDLARKQVIGRTALVTSVLLRSGIEFLNAVDIAARSLRNVILREALTRSCDEVAAGVDLGVALERTGVFPAVVVRVFSIGQQTGRLEEMLERLAADYESQVASMSTRLASVLEPVLILFLSVFVGFILFATILPILEAGNVL